jgi:hypothetical protein
VDARDEEAARALVERHGPALATLVAFTDACGAVRVAVLLDVGAAEGVVVECRPREPAEIVLDDVAYVVPRETTGAVAPLPVEAPHAPPGTAMTVDAVTGEVAAPIGVLPALAEGVLALATALGGRSVVTAEFATRDPETPFTLAARAGEDVVLAVGDEHFAL